MSKFKKVYDQINLLDTIPVRLLGESFRLLDRNFGTDLANKEWFQVKSPVLGDMISATFFTLSGKIYVLMVEDEDGFIKFNVVDNIKDLEDIDKFDWEKFQKFERSPGGNLTMILGAILSILKRSNLSLKVFKFGGADEKLQKTYEFLSTSPYVKKYLKSIGVSIEVKHDNPDIGNYVEVKI